MKRLYVRSLLVLGLLAAFGVGGLVVLRLETHGALHPLPRRLPPDSSPITRPRLLDRDGVPLSMSYQNRWNVHDTVAYHDIPELLREAFVAAEDKRFFEHRGADWLARLHAVVQNLRALRKVRGASTISEQVVRILHPRPRTLWSRWLESIEARRLEDRFSKVEILELYLNQVPYARQRRGVAQAARTYFDRDLDTLSVKETLALAVLVRSPSRLDLERGTTEAALPISRLARRMRAAGTLTDAELAAVEEDPLVVLRPRLPVEAGHFVRFAQSRLVSPPGTATVATTLDASMQDRIQRILDHRVDGLARRQVGDGAVLVVDHERDEILAWVNAGGFSNREGGQIDKVTTPRQPGSTLKPFVYAVALEKGWTAATLIEDAPLQDPVGHGLHNYRNYSRTFYGPLRLREALGNSLNTPAVRTARHVGGSHLLDRLRELGFVTLDQHPDFYGDGLALGNGEVALYELVAAYAALARGGVYRPLRFVPSTQPGGGAEEERRIFDAEVSSLVANILSDPESRRLEFGRHSVLELPLQTAVKTGTSNDYRDAWAMGFSHRYTVGVWMGNVDRREMLEVSGAAGPALVLRAVFAELHRHRESRPLYLSRRLEQVRICRTSGQRARPDCPTADEWFRPGHAPSARCSLHGGAASAVAAARRPPRVESPTPGLHLALDPRIPDELEAFAFRIDAGPDTSRIEWLVDDAVAAVTDQLVYPWPVQRGAHSMRARVWSTSNSEPVETQSVRFLVK